MIGVLVVDDHGLVRGALARLLAAADGIEVLATAADGEEAVRVAGTTAPDVVLMDLAMPGIGGVEATRRLLEIRPTSKVVVLTSLADRERIQAALTAGAIGYLLKDAEPAVIVDAVRSAARGDWPIDPRAARLLLEEGRARIDEPGLSDREREVLARVAEGLPNKLIARRLGITERTVKAHLTRVFDKLGVADRTQAALWAQRHGIESPRPATSSARY